LEVPEVREVHPTESGDVRTVPASPTMMNRDRELDHATALNAAVVPEERLAQVNPSGEVLMLPPLCTARNWVPAHNIP